MYKKAAIHKIVMWISIILSLALLIMGCVIADHLSDGGEYGGLSAAFIVLFLAGGFFTEIVSIILALVKKKHTSVGVLIGSVFAISFTLVAVGFTSLFGLACVGHQDLGVTIDVVCFVTMILNIYAAIFAAREAKERKANYPPQQPVPYMPYVQYTPFLAQPVQPMQPVQQPVQPMQQQMVQQQMVQQQMAQQQMVQPLMQVPQQNPDQGQYLPTECPPPQTSSTQPPQNP